MSSIDLVYTWVNSDGIQLAKERDLQAKLLTGVDQDYRAGEARSRDNGELRYSITQSLKNMPFLRSIIVCGAGGRPDWLPSDSDVVRFIDQNSVVDATNLPTFSSDTVESFIYRIPGLSERYIYSNDDFFVARPHTESDFFNQQGKCLIPASSRLASIGDLSPTFMNMEINAVQALKRHSRPYKTLWMGHLILKQRLKERYLTALHGIPPVNTIDHVALPFLRSEWEGFHRVFARELQQQFSSPFRSDKGFAVNLVFCHYIAARGLAELLLEQPHGYLDRTQPREEWIKFDEAVKGGKYTRFCLNDAPTIEEDGWSEFLRSLFDEEPYSAAP